MLPGILASIPSLAANRLESVPQAVARGFSSNTMICRDFPLFYSTQVDGQASEAEQIALQRHLRDCSTCRRHAAEMRTLRSDLRALAPPQAKPTLTGEIQITLRHEAEMQANRAQRRADWIEAWRTRLFSQGIGAAVSLCMFLSVITGVFRPAYRSAYRALDLAQAATEVIATEVIIKDPTIRAKILLMQPLPPPIFAPNGALLSVGACLSEDQEIMAALKVNKDGTTSIDQIVAPTTDPLVMAKFSNVITQQASFQPVRRNQNTSRDAVVIMIAMNVPGRTSI